MPSWFTITKFPIDSEKCYNFEEAQNSAKIIEKVIEEEVKLIGGNYKNIFIGGFSQGACLSLYTGLTYKHLLGGDIVVSFIYSN
jgi:phospholipase/carboxylesterase